MKIHLVDGTYELFRSYYGAPPASGADGTEVGAIRGLLMTLTGLLRGEDVTHVAVAFDQVIESFRNELFDGYKTGDGIEPALKNQFPLAERAAHALGLVVWPMVEFEADDALATGAARWADVTDQVVICTPDKDLMQCVVADQVVCLDRRRQITYDADGVEQKFGIPPVSIPDWLALVGDSADGIPGIPRWGAKSAALALAHYGQLDQIPDDPEDWQVKVRGAKGLAANLAEMREEAALYRRLATLRTDVPLPETLAELEWRGGRRDEMVALCDEIDDPELVERVERWL